MRFLPAGDGAILIELASLQQALTLYQQAEQQRLQGVQELVPAARTLLVQFEQQRLTAADIVRWLQPFGTDLGADQAPQDGWLPAKLPASATAGHEADSLAKQGYESRFRRIEIPVRYNGADLEAVAQLLGLSRQELIERHTGADYQAAFAGFAPGFVYLAGGDPCFHGVPRHASPRSRVSANTVAMAGDFSAIYPSESPGGWQLLGETPWLMWDMRRPVPALLRPGDTVRFRDLEAVQRSYSLPDWLYSGGTGGVHDAAEKRASSQRTGEEAPDAWLEVVSAGMQTLYQDFGRPGMTSMGVSRSGALDTAAMRRANRLLGNDPAAPVLENLMGGLHLRCHGRMVLAVTGAWVNVRLFSKSGMRLPAAAESFFQVESGDELQIGPVRAGIRVYVAVRGGWDVAPVLGSCSTDLLAGIGPEPLRAGDALHPRMTESSHAQALAQPNSVRVELGQKAGSSGQNGRAAAAQAAALEAARGLPRAGSLVHLDVLPGPRADWFTAESMEILTGQEWLVSQQSNRIGLRLSGPDRLRRRKNEELPSEGTVTGSIQVPAGGEPVLFLADHPLTGGYPVIAVVLQQQLDLLAQVPPGARLRFRATEKFREFGQ